MPPIRPPGHNPVAPRQPHAPRAPAHPPALESEPARAPEAPGPSADALRRLGHTPREQAAEARAILKTFFAPYDNPIEQDTALIKEVMAARATDPASYSDGENPYKIQYAVYNLRNPEVVALLGKAHQAGVKVQVLIEANQLDPAKSHNTADEELIAAGLSFSPTHKGLSDDEKRDLDLIGIEGAGLMHLKARLFSYPDPTTGEPVEKLLTGSMNPGGESTNNDETLHLIKDPVLIERYRAKVQAVLDDKALQNRWSAQAPVNVLFTPAAGGPHPADKILQLVNEEKEAIFLSVFSLRDVQAHSGSDTLLKSLARAKARGVEIVVVTDRKQSDGVDASGKQLGRDDPTEDRIRALGIPVYECINEAGPFNAMHKKSAVFGLTSMKIVTDAGNWSAAALGRRGQPAKNEESFLFIDSKKLDDNATGKRYLSSFLHLLRKYSHQQTEAPKAEALIDSLARHPAWPKVKVDFEVIAQTYMGEEVYITGDHEALGDWTQKGPGLKLNTEGGRYPTWRAETSLSLPFGSSLAYKIVKRDVQSGELRWEQGPNQLLVVDPGSLQNPYRAADGKRLQPVKTFRE
jgi:phosphatidylserine/phosphatidylglycerophosphate/cardiolipin synthase-like enzyme